MLLLSDGYYHFIRIKNKNKNQNKATQKTLSFILFSFKHIWIYIISTENNFLFLLASFLNWTQRKTYDLG